LRQSSEAIGENILIARPDSPQLRLTHSGVVQRPQISIKSAPLTTVAPSIPAISMAARESLQNEGFFISDFPNASRAAAIARCVTLLLDGAIISPEITEGCKVFIMGGLF